MSVPPSGTVTPAAAWMDRLSDRVGSLIPGGSRLPPRHPVKVSLVMGVLGLIAGWVSIAPLLLFQEIMGFGIAEGLMFLTMGLACGLLVFVPLLAWSGLLIRHHIAAPFTTIVAAMAHMKSFAMLSGIEEPDAAAGMLLAGFTCGCSYGIAGILFFHRRWVLEFLVTILVACLSHRAYWFLVAYQGSISFIPAPLDDIVELSLPTLLFAMLYAGIGMGFGISIWDRTPRPKFAPHEPT